MNAADADARPSPRLLAPWEYFAHLSWALDDVAPERQREPALALVQAAHVVIRHFHGQRTNDEAYAALDRARTALLSAANPNPTATEALTKQE